MATSQTEFQVQSLYVGYMGRAAELAGRDFWVSALEQGRATIQQIATAFSTSPEYKANYDGLTNPQFVDAVYKNVLGRPSDPSGLQFWVDALNNGLPKDQLVLQMIQGMSAIDRVSFDTRVQDGNDYTEAHPGSLYNLNDARDAVGLLNTLIAEVNGVEVTSVNEGQTVTFTLGTIDFWPGSVLTYTITGVSADDIVGGQLSGQVTLDAMKKAVVSVTLKADAATEGAENMTMSLGGLSTAVTVNDTSTNPQSTYAITAAQAGYDEGQTAQFDVQTTNVAAGTVLSYAITGVSAADVVGGNLAGTTVVGANGAATIQIGLVADAKTEGNETMTVTLTGKGVSASTTVVDTSKDATYAVDSLQAGYTEGETAVFTVVTTNVAAGTALNYTITGIQAEDVAGGKLTGQVVVGADGKGSITVTLLADGKTEGTETMTVTLDGKGASASATVSDTSLSPSYALAADQAQVVEGSNATFTLTTANVAAGTVLNYTISGVSAADVAGPLTGTATVGSDGKASIVVPTVNDGISEGTETLSVTVNPPGGVPPAVASTSLVDNPIFRLTSGQDGTASQPVQASVFDGSQEDTPLGPINTLNDSDVLQGVGGNAVLNAVMGNTLLSLTTPKMTDVDTVNLAFVSSLTQQFISFQDTTGTDAANITRISGGLSAGIFDMNNEVDELSAANTVLPVPNLIFDYRPGQAPATVAMALTNVTVSDINLGVGAKAGGSTVGTGVTTLNLTSNGTNVIGTSTANGLDSAITNLGLTVNSSSLTIKGLHENTLAKITATGAGDLTLDEVGKAANFQLDASTMTGKVTAIIDNAAGDAGASFKTGSGDDNLSTSTSYAGNLAADITTDGGNDTVTLNKTGNTWADILGSSTIDTGTGNDTVVDGNTQAKNVRSNVGTDGPLSSSLVGYTFTLTGGTLSGVVNLGDGTDTLTTGNVGGTVNGGAGNDTIRILGITGSGSVNGGLNDDTITADGAVAGSGSILDGVPDPGLFGNEGNDTIIATGAVTGGGGVSGGDGNDVIATGAVTTTAYVDGDGGNDDITINGGLSGGGDVDGGSGDDIIRVYGQVNSSGMQAQQGSDKVLIDVTPGNSGLASGTAAVVGSVIGMGTEDDVLWIRTDGNGAGVSGADLRGGSGSDALVFDQQNGTIAIDDGNAFRDWNTVQLFARASTIDIDMDAFSPFVAGQVPARVDLIGTDGGPHNFILRDMYDAADPLGRPDLLVNLTNALAADAPGYSDGSSLDGAVTMNVQVDDRTNSGSDTLRMRLQGPQTFTVNTDDLNGDNVTPGLQTAAFENVAVEVAQDRSATLNYNAGDFRGSMTVTGSQTAGRTTTINGASARTIDASTLASAVYITAAAAHTPAAGAVETVGIWDGSLPPFVAVDRVIKTGSNNDVVDMRGSTLDAGDGAITALGDSVQMGAGSADRLIVGNTTDGAIFGLTDRDEAFEDSNGIEILQIDDNANGKTSFFLGDDVYNAGIRTIETVAGSVTTVTTGLRFVGDTGGASGGAPATQFNVSGTSNLTIDNVNNNNLNVSLWMDRSIDFFGNVGASAGGAQDSVLNFVRAGNQTVNLTVQIDQTAPSLISTAPVAANGTSELQLLVAAGKGGLDSITLIDNQAFPADNPPVTVILDNSWAQQSKLTVDASGIGNDDWPVPNSATGGVIIDGSAEVESKLVLLGSANDDILVAGQDITEMTGGGGNDVLVGSNKAELVMTGGDGNDQLFGNGGNDVINAGAGNDFIVGGAGTDNLTGGPGNDVFSYLNPADSVASNSATPTQDVIMDFDFATDSFNLGVPVVGVGSVTITEGTGTQANFANLVNFLVSRAEIQSLMLPPGIQSLFVTILSPSFAGGGLNGAAGDLTLIIVDTNANDAYDAADLVVQLDDDASYSNPSYWGLNNFGPFGNGQPIATPVITSYADDTGVSNTDNITNDTQLVINGTANANAAVTVFNDGNGNGFRDWNELAFNTTANGAGVWQVTTSVLLDGTYTFHAQSTIGTFISAPSAPQPVTVDTVAPTVTVTLDDTTLTAGQTAIATFQFSEAVAGFVAGDVDLSNASVLLSDFTMVDADTYTAKLTPNVPQDFTNTVGVPAGSYTDVAGNAGGSGVSGNFVIDSQAPSVTSMVLSDTALLAGETAVVTVNFDEAVTGFDLLDMTVENGTLSGFLAVDADTYTAVFTPTPGVEDATNVATVIAGTYTDLAGNAGGGFVSANYTIDTLVPTLTITFDDTQLFAGETANVAFEFSEDVAGFTVGDVVVQNGALSAFTQVDGNSYTALFTPNPLVFDLTNVATVAAGTYTDVPGNPGAAATSANYEVRTTPQPVVGSVQYDQGNNVIIVSGSGFSGVTNVDLAGSSWEFWGGFVPTGTYTFGAADLISFNVVNDATLQLWLNGIAASTIENSPDFGGNALADIDEMDFLAGAFDEAGGNSSPAATDLFIFII